MSEENKNYNFNSENKSSHDKREAYTNLEHIYAGSGGEKAAKEPKKIKLSTFVLSTVALVLAAVMITFTVCFGVYRAKLAEVAESDNGSANGINTAELERLDAIFNTYSYYGVDEEEMGEFLLKAYVAASGDRYAEYFTDEEFDAYMDSMKGNSVGVGINIIYTTEVIGGVEYKVLKVINVTRESPAMKAGVRVGDLLFYVGVDRESRESVHTLGYEETMARLLGDEGTTAEFTVFRKIDDGYEEVPFSIVRGKIKSESVQYRVCETDATVGIVKILQFDYTTPTQFCDAVDTLKSKGVEGFVFDVRYNGGGSLDSIVAVLSYFLDEGDTIISTVDNQGRSVVTKAQVVRKFTGDEASCNVSATDIGKYKDLRAVVLCNSSTASAAELFTATFRDYKIAKTVGETTFGKGSMQSTLPLSYFGVDGVLKLTTNLYFPPCGESYDGIGIVPDVEVALDEALKNKNIYEITDAEDNQLQAAIELLK